MGRSLLTVEIAEDPHSVSTGKRDISVKIAKGERFANIKNLRDYAQLVMDQVSVLIRKIEKIVKIVIHLFSVSTEEDHQDVANVEDLLIVSIIKLK